MATRNPINIGDIVHAYNRGTRKLDIFHDDLDREYFLKALFYLNDSHSISNIFVVLKEKYPESLEQCEWPSDWGERDPLVVVHAYIAMPNHFHLVLEEIRENGISLFMQKIGTGITGRYNIRYKTSGNLFQGRYKSVIVTKDNYLQYLGVYVQIKNAFELYADLKKSLQEFNMAFDFACSYRYGSLSHYAGKHRMPIIDAKTTSEPLFFEAKNRSEYKEFAKNTLFAPDFDDTLAEIKIEEEI